MPSFEQLQLIRDLKYEQHSVYWTSNDCGPFEPVAVLSENTCIRATDNARESGET